MNGMKKSKKIQRLALFLILTLALSMFSTFPGLTNAQESIGSSNAEWILMCFVNSFSREKSSRVPNVINGNSLY
jgi:hypothetical protein